MYENKNFKKTFEDNNSEDDFDFCNTETGQKFAIKWSPSEDVKLISKHRFIGSRQISRSVPRRKRSLFQYKINRSLNFEIGTPRHEAVFKSPNFDSDDSPICNEKYMTRSAKILRSLNINFSPSRARNKRINKTLNFDLSPSPKRIFSSTESLCNKESSNFESNVNSISKINKTLNFSSSSNASNLSSYLGSSGGSIDENQNQTPSHRNRSVKKSLIYLTPSPKQNANLSRSVNKTPMSREEFINNLKCNAETPDLRVIKQSDKKSKYFDGIGVSTPRNLFREFEDDDKEMRPATPENVVQFMPESMSAIKKSHKKERQSNRSEKLYAHQLKEYSNQTENSSEDPMVLSHSEERPATPITNDSYPSPNYSIGSIKQSHKKDKSKKKTIVIHSEDEISDSGSIFDYTELMEEKPDPGNKILDNSSPLSNSSSSFAIIPFEGSDEKRPTRLNNSIEELSDNGSIFDYSETIETKADTNSKDSLRKMHTDDHSGPDHRAKDKEPLKISFDKLELISPAKVEIVEESSSHDCGGNEDRPVTPVNIINVLDQVMSDSIKKSHKKIKDKNKKTSIKTQAAVQEFTRELPSSDNSLEEDRDSSGAGVRYTPENVARAGTPENVNSSRLLLGQYSSVKKSHKKNKHKKIVTESAKRQRYFNNNDQRQSPKDSYHVSGVRTLLSPSNSLGTSASKRCKSTCNESLVVAPVNGIEICSATPDKELVNDRSVEFSAANTSPLERSTPNKRKKSFSLNETGTSTSSIDLSNIESSSMDYESAEEEFKIFTPIKKRRSLRGPNSDTQEIQTTNLEPTNFQSLESTDQNYVTQDGSFKSIDNSFTTPPNRSRAFMVHGENKSESKVSTESFDNGNANGRSTPQNRSTSEMIFDINSIKKSHKKDKRNSRLRRTLNNDDDQNDFRVIKVEETIEDEKPSVPYQTVTPDDSISENDFENPQPSTSFGGTWNDTNINVAPNTETTKTPPNCSKVINYLKLRLADSIKRSHKKIREQKKHSAIDNDPDVSDDGSIFDSSERIESNELDRSTENIEGESSTDSSRLTVAENGNVQAAPQLFPQTPPNRSNLLIQIESIKKSHKKVRELKRRGRCDVGADLSDDGSIFDADESLDESLNDVVEIPESRESSP